jgi:hypothetical protein
MSEPGARLEELAHGVLGPLVLGGTIRPVRPFGAKLGIAFGVERGIVDLDLKSRIDVARVRIARKLTAVDVMPDLDAAEWSLLAAFNDLVQVTNHELSGPLTRSRHQKVLAAAEELLAAVPPCKTPLEAIARHTVLGRVLDTFRTDSSLKWWTGSASFRGRPVSKRLAAWPELRRVNIDRTKVPLAKMVEGIASITVDAFETAVGLLLASSPLTDLATAARATPRFSWTKGTLALIASPIGRPLGTRAIAHGTAAAPHVRAALDAATERMPDSWAHLKPACTSFAEEVGARK